MSTYRLLLNHFVSNQVLPAGSVQSTADVGGLLPVGWIPTPNVDPLDAPAVAAFYAVGPAILGTISGQLLTQFVPRPITYWFEVTTNPWSPEFSQEFGDASGAWALTGLGSALAPINASPRQVG